MTSVTGTAPVVSSGGNTPAISMAAANTTTNGYLTSTDWNTFNGKSNTNGTVTSVAALTLGTTGTDLSSTVANGTTTPVITLQVPTASATNRGALSSTDWSTFNGKQAALVSGTNIKTVNGTSLLGSGDVGTIDVSHGGTGLTSLTAGYIPYGNGTGALNSSVNLTFNGTSQLGLGSNVAIKFGDSSYIKAGSTLGFLVNDSTDSYNYYRIFDATGVSVWYPSGTEAMRLTSTGLNVTGTIKTQGYTVATLPTGVTGARAYVTNALAPTYGTTVVGGGAVTIPVFYNGTNWICA